MKKGLLIASLLATASAGAAVNISLAPPLNIPLELSANFAELRPNHFHGGLDFKTQGRCGLPIYAPASGYISRIEVSPSSYGNALYVTHPAEGIVTVYGHLDNFMPEIEELVLKQQMADESFSVTIDLFPFSYPVNKGEKIAISGNTGHSGGPHLHFEVRDLMTGYHLDPLVYYADKIKDSRKPYKKAIQLFPKPGEGAVGDELTAWGRIYPSIQCNDAMDGQNNIYGVKDIRLWVDGQLFFSRRLDHFAPDNTRAINTLVDYASLLNDSRWMEWTRQPQARPLMDGTLCVATLDGALVIDQERDYECVYELTDHYGNTSRYPFTIHGRKSSIPSVPAGTVIPWLTGGQLSAGAMNVNIPALALYDDTPFIVKALPDNLYNISTSWGPIPMALPMTVSIQADAASINNPNQVVITRVGASGNKRAAITSWQFTPDGKIIFSAPVTATGSYTLATDTTGPTITPDDATAFIITDDLSGILDFRAEIDGKFVVMEYDLKNDRLRLKPGTKAPSGSTFTLRVIDHAGNNSTYRSTL